MPNQEKTTNRPAEYQSEWIEKCGWTAEEAQYNDQINFVEHTYDFHPEVYDVLDDQTLDLVYFYLGLDKYDPEDSNFSPQADPGYIVGENFLQRRQRILQNNPDLKRKAIAAMHQVTSTAFQRTRCEWFSNTQINEDGHLWGFSTQKMTDK